MQFEIILPFLKPIEHLILDPDISEIMVNAVPGFISKRMASSLPYPASQSPNRPSRQR